MGNFLRLDSKGVISLFIFKQVSAFLKAKSLLSYFYKPKKMWGKAGIVVGPTLTCIFSSGHDETF